MNGVCRLIPTTWEWKEEIDVDRARTSKQKAEGIMKQTGLSEKDLKLAEARLHRALVRIGTAGE